MSFSERVAPLVLAASLICAVDACKRRRGDPPEEIRSYVETATPAAKRSLAALKAAAKMTLELPPLEVDGAYSDSPVVADVHDIAVLVIEFGLKSKIRGTTFDYVDRWGGVRQAVEGRIDQFSTVAEATSAFERVGRVEYVFVLKVVRREDPVVTNSSAQGAFVPGKVSAEAHLFSLESPPKHLGGFRFGATNSPTLSVSAQGDKVYDEAKRRLARDLSEQVKIAFLTGVKRFGGGSCVTTLE